MRLLKDSALRVRLSKRARHLIEAEFDIHANTRQLRAIFDEARRGPAESD